MVRKKIEDLWQKLDLARFLSCTAYKTYDRSGWTVEAATTNLEAVTSSFSSMMRNATWVEDVIKTIPTHIKDAHVASAAKAYFQTLHRFYIDASRILHVAIIQLRHVHTLEHVGKV